MSEENRKAVIEGLNGVCRDLEHMSFRDDRDRAAIEGMRRLVLDGLKLIYEQENLIKALMGDFGDACDVDGECGKSSESND